jgi:AraC family transcriptional activator of pyochelin receptor
MAQAQSQFVGETDYILVSPEMTAYFGPETAGAPIPPRPVEMIVEPGPRAWTLRVNPTPSAATPVGRPDRFVFLIQRDAIERLGGSDLLASSGFHLTAELRAIALALREPTASFELRSTYRLAKCIEFVCEAIRQVRGGELAPLTSDGQLSPADTRRMLAARQLIEDRAGEKLTLDYIARSCGLNRSKLTRGFKELFDCTVAEAIAARRLETARRMLLTTDLPVSSIGYVTGYQNNASFTRAFGRRFGRTPSDLRTSDFRMGDIRELAA